MEKPIASFSSPPLPLPPSPTPLRRVHPLAGAVRVHFLFPDGDGRLDPVDRGAARFEGLRPVRRDRQNGDGDFAHAEISHSMLHVNTGQRPLALEGANDFRDLALSHLPVGLILDARRGPFFFNDTEDTEKEADGAIALA